VTDAGSVWSNRVDFYVGNLAGGNRLVVTNGGVALLSGTAVVGATTTSIQNRLAVDGGALLATNSLVTAALDVRRGTNVLNSGRMDLDFLLVTNPTQGFFEFNGGTLVTRGAFISNNVPFTVGRGGATPALWDVRAGVANHLLAGQLIVGSNSSFNQLFITNGGTLEGKTTAFLAFTSGSNNGLRRLFRRQLGARCLILLQSRMALR
jgi:hypothetical protein